MTFIYPDFYPGFACTADKCRHSCCRGWEIDIDECSAERYLSMPGEWGKRLRSVIETGPTPHFCLTEEENCPFLRQDGLCEMILGLGEDSLCDICREHPRFYNEFPGRMEAGLGLCCEEAARLLLAGEGPLRFIEETEAGESPAPLPPVLRLREKIFAALWDESLPLLRRMERAMEMTGAALLPWDLREIAEFLQSLEQMDPAWSALLEKLKGVPGGFPPPEGMMWARIAAYLIYRHFGAGETMEECALYLQFAFMSTALLRALEQAEPENLQEHLRLFSGEIEYSDENIDAILDFLEGKTE